MKVLILDNYDSFTFNLYQYIGELLSDKRKKFSLDVFKNDEITFTKIKKRYYDRIILSPGPGDPSNLTDFGVCSDVLIHLGKMTPILGVCLGMQGIAYYYGGKIVAAKVPMHGKKSRIIHDGLGVFKGLNQDIEVMRYHSLIVDEKSLPSILKVTAVSKDTNEIMGVRHGSYPIEGIQFHPEAFATEQGIVLLKNFLF